MSLIEKLRADQLQARKDRNAVASDVLSYVIGEAVKIGKLKENREPTDDETQNQIAKTAKQLKDALPDVEKNAPDKAERQKYEIAILEAYLPKQMSQEALRMEIRAFKDTNPGTNMGAVMAHLKANFTGQYDGKLASQIAKEVLG